MMTPSKNIYLLQIMKGLESRLYFEHFCTYDKTPDLNPCSDCGWAVKYCEKCTKQLPTYALFKSALKYKCINLDNLKQKT